MDGPLERRKRAVGRASKLLDVLDQIKVALATEAFPDEGGRAFMASLEQHFPRSYQQLLGNLTKAASSGACPAARIRTPQRPLR